MKCGFWAAFFVHKCLNFPYFTKGQKPTHYYLSKNRLQMAKIQKFGIKFPFTNDNVDNVYMDTNDTYAEGIKSQVAHVILTPKGQKLRDPDFGTSLIDYIFGPKDETTLSLVKEEITTQLGKYVPAVQFKNIEVYSDPNGENGIIVSITYSLKIGNKTEDTTVAIKI